MKTALVLIISATLSSAALAQPQPPREGPPPPRPERDAPPPREGRPPAPGVEPASVEQLGENHPLVRMRQFELMRGYLDAVDRYARLTRDPSTAGIAAVVSTSDLLKGRGADAGIEYFTKVLPEVKNRSVERAIRLQLVELYKQAGKQDQALEQLRALMTAEMTTAEEEAALRAPAPPPLPPPGSREPGR